MADILVVGLSARALAQSARRSGYAPLAADFFNDLDLSDSAAASIVIEGGIAAGFEQETLCAALTTVARGRAPIGVVCGAGFEASPDLVGWLAGRWPIIGNSAAAVQEAKDPEHLANLCARLGIPHPEVRVAGNCGAGWLRKQRGASGGGHIGDGSERRGDSYWQRVVEGEGVSALTLGDGRRALAIGLSAQWTDPAPGARYRYGGAVRPADVDAGVAKELMDAAEAITSALALTGLNSVDFLVADETWHLIEVNPRPGATLDIFDSDDAPLFALHVAACRGELPGRKPDFAGAAAARIVYAKREVESMPHFEWPDWTADRQRPGTKLAPGDPLCTVLARATTAVEARRLVEARREKTLAAIGAG